jgi:Ca2+-binding RTX toxin-like protein
MANVNVLPDWSATAFLSAMIYADDRIFAAGAIFGIGPDLTTDSYTVTNPDGTIVRFSGDGFLYDAQEDRFSGAVDRIDVTAIAGHNQLAAGQSAPLTLDFASPVTYDISFIDVNIWLGDIIETWRIVGDVPHMPAMLVLDKEDTMFGGPGSDVLASYAGNDTIAGGGGDDLIDGGSGSDTVDYSQEGNATARAGVYVDLATGGALDRYGSMDQLIDIENVIGTDGLQPGGATWSDALYGSDTANFLDGREGNDAIEGRDGSDTLVGGQGSDWLTGGDGADFFVFEGASIIAGEFDIIWDFFPGFDAIWLPTHMAATTAIVQEEGKVTIYSDTGAGLLAIGVVGNATVEEVTGGVFYV